MEGYSSGGRFLPDRVENPLRGALNDEANNNAWAPDNDLHQNQAAAGGYIPQNRFFPNQAVITPQGAIYSKANDHVRSGLANWSGMAGSGFQMGTAPGGQSTAQSVHDLMGRAPESINTDECKWFPS